MKELIASIASLMLLMIFVLQFAANQNLLSRVALADAVIESFVGSDTPETDKLREEAARALGLAGSEVTVSESAEGIYTITAPLTGVIACGSLLGLDEKENMVIYKKTIGAGNEDPDNNDGHPDIDADS